MFIHITCNDKTFLSRLKSNTLSLNVVIQRQTEIFHHIYSLGEESSKTSTPQVTVLYIIQYATATCSGWQQRRLYNITVSLWWESTSDWWIPCTENQYHGKCPSHEVIRSSYIWDSNLLKISNLRGNKSPNLTDSRLVLHSSIDLASF